MSEYSKEELIQMFTAVGLEPKFATETSNNKKISAALAQIIKDSGSIGKTYEKTVGTLFAALAGKLPPTSKGLMQTNSSDLYNAITSGDISTTAQLNGAINYFKKQNTFDMEAFKKESGIGVVITVDDIKAYIDKLFADNRAEIEEQRYKVNGKFLGLANKEMPFADKVALKDYYDAKFLEVCGERRETDVIPNKGQEQMRLRAEEETRREELRKAREAASAAEEQEEEDDFVIPDDYLKGREMEWAVNTPEVLERVKAETGGKVITRFPPEPNGYLHIGHAKAMFQNFGVAEKFNGRCIMRFDDTNPEAEEKEYIETILENLDALDHKPWKITYSSDYFEDLYQLAIKLIKKGKAYVCHQTREEIQRDRAQARENGAKVPPSPYRERSVEENLRLFENMRRGLYKENECTLRMKGDLESPNPNMWDQVFYRIRYTPHPHAGDKWCLYPTYDYTHCIIDSLENITYSMCTLEFENRRESYYWLLHELDLYKPKVWEYSRLNITHNVLSKRRLRALVMDNHVNGWDDPRLLTINGLRRRGFTGPIINAFIKSIGISRSASTVPYERLFLSARNALNLTATRAMVVVDPLKVVLTNVDANTVTYGESPNLPGSDDTHKVPFSRVIYIEREDFMVDPPKSFIRLAPGRTVHLKYAYNITATGYKTDAAGNVTEVEAEVDFESSFKPQGKLHFVAEPAPGQAPHTAELRLYNELFKSADPMAVTGDWVSDLNPDSLVVKTAYIDSFLLDHAKVGSQYQFERVGYFIVDPDSDVENKKFVFNRTCPLREVKKIN